MADWEDIQSDMEWCALARVQRMPQRRAWWRRLLDRVLRHV